MPNELTPAEIERLRGIQPESPLPLAKIDDITQACLEIMNREPPVGAFVDNQKYPDGFDVWTETRKQNWAKDIARAIYMAQCSHFEQTQSDMRKAISEGICSIIDYANALPAALNEIERLRKLIGTVKEPVIEDDAQYMWTCQALNCWAKVFGAGHGDNVRHTSECWWPAIEKEQEKQDADNTH